MPADMNGKGVLVVGASSGIGRVVARHFAIAGARVAFAARRAAMLQAAADEAGGGLVIVGDVRKGEDCDRIVAEAISALGGLDLVVYATGVVPLGLLEDEDAESWRAVFETNTIGAFLVARAALPHLSEQAIFAYFSSVAIEIPYYGLGQYRASKAALNVGMEAFHLERPDVRITRFTIGDTMGTEAGANHDPELAGRLIGEFHRHGILRERYLEVNTVGKLIAEVLTAALDAPDTRLGDVSIRPMGPPLSAGIDAAAALSVVEEFHA
jgi:NAD(P)-dependent dehydrogenase (short-subunit alcohol dehydrogenase family)